MNDQFTLMLETVKTCKQNSLFGGLSEHTRTSLMTLRFKNERVTNYTGLLELTKQLQTEFMFCVISHYTCNNTFEIWA